MTRRTDTDRSTPSDGRATTRVLHRRAAIVVLGGAAASALAACGGAQASGASGGARHEEAQGEEGITATEDLMREHGVLRRLFLVYDEVARRARAGEAYDPALVVRASRLVRTFVEDYHERAEERWVFPVVQQTAALAPTVAVLLTQHERGRQVTDAISGLAGQGAAAGSDTATRLAALCEAFNRMYRAHAAREDAVIFPALRSQLRPHDFAELGERMEEAEHSTVGEGGFERAVVEVAAIERGLGIDDLARFTAAVPSST